MTTRKTECLESHVQCVLRHRPGPLEQKLQDCPDQQRRRYERSAYGQARVCEVEPCDDDRNRYQTDRERIPEHRHALEKRPRGLPERSGYPLGQRLVESVQSTFHVTSISGVDDFDEAH